MAKFELQKLKEAIHKYLAVDTNDFKTAIGARFYDTEQEDESTPVYPRCFYSFLPGQMDRDSATKYEKPIIRFTLYDDYGDSSRITEDAALLDARFDECESALNALVMVPATPSVLGITGMKILDVQRISTLSNLVKTGLGNWQLVVDYRIHIQRT